MTKSTELTLDPANGFYNVFFQPRIHQKCAEIGLKWHKQYKSNILQEKRELSDFSSEVDLLTRRGEN